MKHTRMLVEHNFRTKLKSFNTEIDPLCIINLTIGIEWKKDGIPISYL